MFFCMLDILRSPNQLETLTNPLYILGVHRRMRAKDQWNNVKFSSKGSNTSNKEHQHVFLGNSCRDYSKNCSRKFLKFLHWELKGIFIETPLELRPKDLCFFYLEFEWNSYKKITTNSPPKEEILDFFFNFPVTKLT